MSIVLYWVIIPVIFDPPGAVHILDNAKLSISTLTLNDVIYTGLIKP